MSRDHIASAWSLAVGSDSRDSGFAREELLIPSIPQSAFTRLLAGLLPNRDHNSDLLRWIERLPLCSDSPPLCSVFAADPFIKGRRIAETLLGKGYGRIVNWPTTAQYGKEFCRSLDSVCLGPQQELQNLSRLAAQGLAVSVAVCTAEAAMPFLDLDPEHIFLAPSVELWTDAGFCAEESLRRCALLSRMLECRTPIVLMLPQGSATSEDARRAGASSVLFA